jgi:hypothetical protein
MRWVNSICIAQDSYPRQSVQDSARSMNIATNFQFGTQCATSLGSRAFAISDLPLLHIMSRQFGLVFWDMMKARLQFFSE